MATYTTHNFTHIELQSGHLKVSLLYDSSLGVLTPPLNFNGQISPLTERIEINTGVIEIPTLEVDMPDVNGFWFSLIESSVSNGYAMPELQFIIDEGSGDTYLFSGRIEPRSFESNERLYATPYREVRFTLVSALSRLADTSWTTFLDDLIGATYTLNDTQAHCVTENETGTTVISGITGGGVDYTNDGITMRYRVACRNSNGEYLWSSEATFTQGCGALGPTAYHAIAVTAIAGATYALYRTYSSSGAYATGLIMTTGSYLAIRDSGESPASVSTSQTHFSARKYIRVADFFRQIICTTFGESYSSSLLSMPFDEIKAGGRNIEEMYILAWQNYGTVTSPNMARTPLLLSTDSKYLGDKFDLMEFIGLIAKQFGYYPRYFWNLPFTRNEIHLISRGRGTNYATMAGEVLTSKRRERQNKGDDIVLIRRALGTPNEYYSNVDNPTNPNYELGLYFVSIPTVASGDIKTGVAYYVTGTIAYHSWNPTDGIFIGVEGVTTYTGTGVVTVFVNPYEKIFGKTVSGGTVTFSALGAVTYWDYTAGADISSSYGFAMQEAVCKYTAALDLRSRRQYNREYNSLQVTISGVTSQEKIFPGVLTQINDGISTRNYYANEVIKDVVNNVLSITWYEL